MGPADGGPTFVAQNPQPNPPYDLMPPLSLPSRSSTSPITTATRPPPPSSKGGRPLVHEDQGWSHVPGKYPFPIPQNAEISAFVVKKFGEVVNVVGKKQFLIETRVSSKDEVKYPKILIDTGAQPNLVREGLFPKHLFHASSRPLHLQAANQKKD